MSSLIIVENPANWPFTVPRAEVAAARAYLTDPKYAEPRRFKVFNLCRSYGYQSVGYYVSLLAEARGHKPRPGVITLQDMKSPAMLRMFSEEMEELVQKSLHPIKSNEFVLSIYFGRNLAKRYDRLSTQLSNLFEAPLLRANFARNRKGTWTLSTIRPIPASEIPKSHRPEVVRFAQEYFRGRGGTRRPKAISRYDIALLWNPEDPEPPSNEKALKGFEKAAEELGIRVWRITKDDFSRLGEFDGLFIRETTSVNHHTYRFARRAARDGLVVIDDPESIVRCSNKVFLAELFDRHNVPAPKTTIVHGDNVEQVLGHLGLPCVLKRPDSSFSTGVVKVETEEELRQAATDFLETSELFIAQEFMRTDFDWRIGLFEGEALYACRYHMAHRHWQIFNWKEKGENERYGNVDTVPLDAAPRHIVKTAVKAARLIGNGLYGVDLKEIDGKSYVIEVNDNPSIDGGFEDGVLGMDLYRRIMGGFLRRIEARTRGDLRA